MEAAPLDSANPLLRAVFLRRLRLTRLLLDGGAYVNESDGRGQTPLMVACRTQHDDGQSASRVRLVQFLLERGADPNIQDKSGRSALIHACRELAGPEVVALLLGHGADVSLEDQTGTSALVYGVTAGDWKVVRLLLDTCKAKGKEVIIITANKLPSGKLEAKQYLSMPPFSPTLAAPTSPSEVQLITSPQPGLNSNSSSTQPVFSFKETSDCGISGVSSHPCSPSRLQPSNNGLLRLNSEPWLKIPASVLPAGPQSDINHNQILQPALSKPDVMISQQSDTEESLQMFEDSLSREKRSEEKHPGQKISLPGLFSSSHSVSHPNLNSENLGGDSTMAMTSSSSFSSIPSRRSPANPFHNMASSSLYTIIQKRKLGADIYSSDPQIAMNTRNIPEEPEENSERQQEQQTESRRLVPLRCSSTLGLNRKVLSRYERRGSGAFLLDQPCPGRPNALPPLSCSRTSVMGGFGTGGGGGAEKDFPPRTSLIPSAPPGHPKEMSRRTLLRRHSMQAEYKTAAQ